MGGPVWEAKGQWQDQSPFRYAAAWKTPSLITDGEIDYRVPLNESITTFKILQRLGVASRLVVFPDEGHWILKGENSRRHMAEVRAWLATYLQPGSAGAPIRTADKTGHVSNYDEAKAGTYHAARSAEDWPTASPCGTPRHGRRSGGPSSSDSTSATSGAASRRGRRRCRGRAAAPETARRDASSSAASARSGPPSNAPRMNLKVVLPAGTSKPAPIILLIQFGGGGAPVADPPLAGEILARGWGYATVGYNDIQPDKDERVRPGRDRRDREARPATTSGATSARGRGASAASSITSTTDPAIDARKIALHGHSRIGKTALWASALDTRVAAVYASCPGEMGAALSRRDYGETVDDMAQRFPYWFDRNFQKWVGKWNEMPVDAHTLIALSAPRPVFVTGGSDDQWADPVGEFKALVAAGPVYRLLGPQGSRHVRRCRRSTRRSSPAISAGTTTRARTRRPPRTGKCSCSSSTSTFTDARFAIEPWRRAGGDEGFEEGNEGEETGGKENGVTAALRLRLPDERNYFFGVVVLAAFGAEALIEVATMLVPSMV